MTKDELLGVARAVLASGFAWAASKGYIPFLDDATKQALIIAIATALVARWSVKAKRA